MWKTDTPAGGLFMVLLLLTGTWCFSQEAPAAPPAPGYIFVETEPAGVFFRLNGSLQYRKTPVLLQDLPPGEYSFDFWKDGYEPAQVTLNLQAGEVKVLKNDLKALFAPVVFPGEEEVVINGQSFPASSRQFLLPHGRYSLERTSRGTEVRPVFPGENTWFLSALGLAATALGSGAATYWDLNSPWSARFPLSPPTLGIYSLFLGDLGWFISLSLQKADFEGRVRTVSAPVQFAPAPLSALMAQGEAELAQGNFEEAMAFFQNVLDYYPESVQAAEALFRQGRIHSLFGRTEQAEVLFTFLLREYPLSSLWDRTQKALGDLALTQGDGEKALFHFGKILYLDPLITREDLAAAREEVERMRTGGAEE